MKNFGDAFYDPFGGPFNELKKMIQPEPDPSFESLLGMVTEATHHFERIYGKPPLSVGVSSEWMQRVRLDLKPQKFQMTYHGMVCNVCGLNVHEVPNLRGIAVVLKEGM